MRKPSKAHVSRRNRAYYLAHADRIKERRRKRYRELVLGRKEGQAP